MNERIYLYPLIIRIWHVLNALFILTLIITGVSMQSTGSVYQFINFNLAVKIHDIFGILLSVNYLIYLIANYKTGNTKHYFYKTIGFINQMGRQFRYYTIGIFNNEEHPFPVTVERKFNPLQQFSYIIVMYFLVPLMILTGIAFLFPTVIFNRIIGLPGIFLNDMVHVLTGFFCTMFMFIHLYFCTIGDTFTSNFKSMITGWHKTHKSHHSKLN
jgi:thiosulfate reductase cytochrome b subunit